MQVQSSKYSRISREYRRRERAANAKSKPENRHGRERVRIRGRKRESMEHETTKGDKVKIKWTKDKGIIREGNL